MSARASIRGSRTVVLALVAVGAVVAVAARVSRRLFEAPETAALGRPGPRSRRRTAPPPPGDDPHVFEVMSATGKVEVQRGGRLGADPAGRHAHARRRRPHLRRVGRRAAAGGRNGDRAARGRRDPPRRVGRRAAPPPRHRPAASADGAGGGASVDLRRGKVLARVGAAGALADQRARHPDHDDGPARFVVLADEHGRVSVAAIEGTTRFAAAGKSVTLRRGTASASQAGGAARTIPSTSPKTCS